MMAENTKLVADLEMIVLRSLKLSDEIAAIEKCVQMYIQYTGELRTAWNGEAANIMSERLSENIELMQKLIDTLSFGKKGLEDALKVYRENDQEMFLAVKSIL